MKFRLFLCAVTASFSVSSNPLDQLYNRSVTTTGTEKQAPLLNENRGQQNNFHLGHNFQKGYGFGNINNDNCTDMVIAPTYFSHHPYLKLEVWLGDCAGGFKESTASVISGEVPTTRVVNNVFIQDFNNDGINDIFIVDQGLEDTNVLEWFGAVNRLLLSGPDQKLHLQDDSFMPENYLAFNHVSSIGDVNQDGYPDILLTRMGGPKVGTGGYLLLINNGTGHFIDGSSLMPKDLIAGWTNKFVGGTSQIADVDGDNFPELIVANYDNPAPYFSDYAIGSYVLKLKDGKYIINSFSPLTPALTSVRYNPKDIGRFRGLGCASIAVGDYDSDGIKDMALLWEGDSSRLQTLKGMGNGQFQDVTDAWGSLVDDKAAERWSPKTVHTISKDGKDELFMVRATYIHNLKRNSPLIKFTDKWTKVDFVNSASKANIVKFFRIGSKASNLPLSYFPVDLNNDGIQDMLAVWYDPTSYVKKTNTNAAYFRKFKIYAAVRKG